MHNQVVANVFVFFSISVAFVMYASAFVTLAEKGLCSVSKVVRSRQTVFRATLRIAFVGIIALVAALLPAFAPIAGLGGALGIVRAMHAFPRTHSVIVYPHSIRWWFWHRH